MLFVLALLLAGCGKQIEGAGMADLPKSFVLTSAPITLPVDAVTLPSSAEIVTLNCTGCHSAEMITSQPRLDAQKWQLEIAKMRKVFHAPIEIHDDAKLVTALMQLQRPSRTAY